MKNKEENKCMAKLILSCNFMGGDSYALVNNVEEYYNRLEALLEDLKQGKGESCNYLYFAFVSLASATLEYSLNFMLAVHCFIKYHVPMYEEHLQPFLDMKFASKIENTPKIISEGDYIVKRSAPTIQQLKELVKKRHSLMHNSKAARVEKFSFPILGAEETNGGIFIPQDTLNDNNTVEFSIDLKNNDITWLSPEWCMRMGNAILVYRDCVVTPYLSTSGLVENELLEKNQ